MTPENLIKVIATEEKKGRDEIYFVAPRDAEKIYSSFIPTIWGLCPIMNIDEGSVYFSCKIKVLKQYLSIIKEEIK